MAAIENNICPFCNQSAFTWEKYPKYSQIGYSLHGNTKSGIIQYFHNSCFDNYIRNQKKKNCKVGESKGEEE